MTTLMRRERTPDIRRYVVTAYARDQVARALHDVVVVGLEFGPHDLPQAADREWLRGAMALPIQEATEAALETLNRSLARTLEQAPEEFVARYLESHRLDDLGLD